MHDAWVLENIIIKEDYLLCIAFSGTEKSFVYGQMKKHDLPKTQLV